MLRKKRQVKGKSPVTSVACVLPAGDLSALACTVCVEAAILLEAGLGLLMSEPPASTIKQDNSALANLYFENSTSLHKIATFFRVLLGYN